MPAETFFQRRLLDPLLPHRLQAGMKLDRGRYEVLEPLKSGGMGAAYLINDNRVERKCVLKEMVPPSHGPAEQGRAGQI